MAGAGDYGRWTPELLDEMRHIGDDHADAAVARVLDSGGVDEVNALLHTLVRVDQPVPDQLPREVKDYLTTTLPFPDWYDPELIERAEKFFEVFGVQICVCLFCASLPSSYAAADGVKVLYRTARLDTDTRRRVMETGQFLMDILSPGGLSEQGPGRRVVQRVRLMHAAVRHLIEQRAKDTPGMWREEWGRPINQEHLAGTLLAFSYVVAEPLPRLGIDVTDADAEAYFHMWNVVGHQLGISDRLRVNDRADATGLVNLIRDRHFAWSPEGVEMTDALLKLLYAMTPFEHFDHYVPEVIRHLVGDHVADLVGVPQKPIAKEGWAERLGLLGVEKIFDRFEDEAERVTLLRHLAEPFGKYVLRGMFSIERGGERAPFNIPDTLARSWDLVAT